MASLTDVLTSMQQGVVALNNLAQQAKGSFLNIAGKLAVLSPGVAWTAYTPTVSATTGTLTSYTITSARYQQMGKIVHIEIDVTITNAGTGSGFLNVTLPVTNGTNGAASMIEIAVTAKSGTGIIEASNIFFLMADATTPVVTGYRLVSSGVYEAA